jgi:hypothetical protein
MITASGQFHCARAVPDHAEAIPDCHIGNLIYPYLSLDNDTNNVCFESAQSDLIDCCWNRLDVHAMVCCYFPFHVIKGEFWRRVNFCRALPS